MLSDFILTSPELTVLTMSCLVLLVDLFIRYRQQRYTYILTQLTLMIGALMTGYLYYFSDTTAFHGLFIHDQVALLLKLTIYLTSLLVFALSRDYLISKDIPQGEFYLLGLFSILGMLVIVSAHHFLSLYLGIELMSLPLYAMVALYRQSDKAVEAAIKYFVLGAISSGLLLYGLSLLYGVTHNLEMDMVAQSIAKIHQQASPVLILGLVFVIVGLAFKLGAVPFHMWIPDVYEGAPLAGTLFITVAPKIAAFAAVYRLLSDTLPLLHVEWQQLIIVLSVLSMILGNVAAIIQTNLRRMFAYSTIAHAGYILLGIAAGTPNGFAASLYYVMVYGLLSIGSFGILTLLSRRGTEIQYLDDLRGLSLRSPLLALIMMLVLFSMAGIPPTVGFFAKLGVLQAIVYAAGGKFLWLACLAIILAVMGSYYYLKVVKVMYFDQPLVQEPVLIASGSRWAINLTGLGIVFTSLLPSSLIEAARFAVLGA